MSDRTQAQLPHPEPLPGGDTALKATELRPKAPVADKPKKKRKQKAQGRRLLSGDPGHSDLQLAPRPPSRIASNLGKSGLLHAWSACQDFGYRTWVKTMELVDVIWPVIRDAKIIAFILTSFRTVSRLGWAVLAILTLTWITGAYFGWLEFLGIAAALFILFLISAFFLIGKTQLYVELDIKPLRVRVGESAAAQLAITNVGKWPLVPVGVELPVGSASARFTTGMLTQGGTFSDVVVIPTTKRAVVTCGPVRTQRGDPFGLLRREIAWTEPIELFIHPTTVPLGALGSGFLRDLEGQTTNDVSMSDLAFHTLREYAPGDDRRYIHWRSSAKRSALMGRDEFLVRQFLDTRRSHIAVFTDVDENNYRDEDEFELAASVAASIALRAVLDEMELSIFCGPHVAVRPASVGALDTFSRAELGNWTLPNQVGRISRLAPDASVVILVTSNATSFATLQHCKGLLPFDVKVVVLEVQPGVEVGIRETLGMTVLQIGALMDLIRIVDGGLLS